MFKTIYQYFIKPQTKNSDQYNRELVLNWVLVGIICMLVIYSVNTSIRVLLLAKLYQLPSLIIINLVLAILLIYILKFRNNMIAQKVVSFALLVMLFTIGIFISLEWGTINPFGIQSFGLFIVTAGILLGARYSLYATIFISIALLLIEYFKQLGFIHPDLSWTSNPSTMTDVINFSALFFILALISWLFNKQMETSLQRAKISEAALKKERDMLETKVEERTRALQEAQLEKVQQFYKFAELGHLSTALFHDLAGNLSSLSIDIESLRKKDRSNFTKRIDSNIHYIDSVVQRVKSQIQGKDSVEVFNVISETKDLVGILSFNARKARTKIELQTPTPNTPMYFTGNLTRFRQLIINLLSNAIEAYPPAPDGSPSDRLITIAINETPENLHITVSDRGKGIQKSKQDKIFEPFYTTKSSGTGIGLFIVRQVTETDFHGTINLHSSKKSGTTFSITLPKRLHD